MERNQLWYEMVMALRTIRPVPYIQTRCVRGRNGQELLRPVRVEHTKNPLEPQFDNLIDTGYITVGLLLCRPSGNGDTISFKIKKRAMPMLFPESEQIQLR